MRRPWRSRSAGVGRRPQRSHHPRAATVTATDAANTNANTSNAAPTSFSVGTYTQEEAASLPSLTLELHESVPSAGTSQAHDATQRSLHLEWSASETQDTQTLTTEHTQWPALKGSSHDCRSTRRVRKAVKVYDPDVEAARPQFASKQKVQAPCAVRTVPSVEDTGVSIDPKSTVQGPMHLRAAESEGLTAGPQLAVGTVVARTVSSQEFLSSLQAFGETLNSSTANHFADESLSVHDNSEDRPCSTQQGSEYLASLALGSEADRHTGTAGLLVSNETQADACQRGEVIQQDRKCKAAAEEGELHKSHTGDTQATQQQQQQQQQQQHGEKARKNNQ